MKKDGKGLKPNSIAEYRPSSAATGARSGKMSMTGKGGSFKQKGDSMVPRKA